MYLTDIAIFFDGLILANAGDKLDGEGITDDSSFLTESSNLVSSSQVAVSSYGNQSGTFGFTAVFDFDTPQERLSYHLIHKESFAGGRQGELRVGTMTQANACISRLSFVHQISPHGKARLLISYEFVF